MVVVLEMLVLQLLEIPTQAVEEAVQEAVTLTDNSLVQVVVVLLLLLTLIHTLQLLLSVVD